MTGRGRKIKPHRAADEQTEDAQRERRARLLSLLAQTVGDPSPTDVKKLLATLKAAGYESSRATFYRDLAALRAENEKRRSDKDPVEWIILAQAQFQTTIRHLWAELGAVDREMDVIRAFQPGQPGQRGPPSLTLGQAYVLRNKIYNDILERTERYILLMQKLGLAPAAPLEPGQLSSQVAVQIIVDAVTRMNPKGDEKLEAELLQEMKGIAIKQARKVLPPAAGMVIEGVETE